MSEKKHTFITGRLFISVITNKDHIKKCGIYKVIERKENLIIVESVGIFDVKYFDSVKNKDFSHVLKIPKNSTFYKILTFTTKQVSFFFRKRDKNFNIPLITLFNN